MDEYHSDSEVEKKNTKFIEKLVYSRYNIMAKYEILKSAFTKHLS